MMFDPVACEEFDTTTVGYARPTNAEPPEVYVLRELSIDTAVACNDTEFAVLSTLIGVIPV